LEGWLVAVPAVHLWISEHLGLRPREAESIEQWWHRLSRSTDPVLPHELFLAGRRSEAKQLVERLKGPAALTTVQSEWAEDCKGFIHASMLSAEDWADAPPLVLISSHDVWNRV